MQFPIVANIASVSFDHAIETFNVCQHVYPRIRCFSRMLIMPFVLLWGMISITLLRYEMWHTIAMVMSRISICSIPRCRNSMCRIQVSRISVCRIPINRISICNLLSNMPFIIVPSVHICMFRLSISNMYLPSLCP